MCDLGPPGTDGVSELKKSFVVPGSHFIQEREEKNPTFPSHIMQGFFYHPGCR